MKILQLISSSLGYYGAERVVVTLSAALEEMGVNTVVAAFVNTAKANHIEVLEHAKGRGLTTEKIICRGRYDRSAVHALRGIIERHKVDVVHCHGVKPDLYAALAKWHKNIPTVSTCHLWVFDCAKDWVVSAVERCILHNIDRVVVVSEQILPQLRRFGLRADVIHNGIDIQPTDSPVSDFSQKMNWSGRPVIGAIGRLAPQKGLQYLLQAAPEVLRDSPNALFIFAGDGPERQSLESQAKSLGIQGSVCFLGVRKDVPELFSSIDVLALPSLSEGTPMTLLEGMAAGRAVVASRVGAVPNVIQDGVNGILLSPGDVAGLAAALQTLLNDSELRIALGRKARKTVESHFSAAAMANRYVEIYDELASSSQREAVSAHPAKSLRTGPDDQSDA
jgi:glycosyltransferase involved in cell wall biosynthesis